MLKAKWLQIFNHIFGWLLFMSLPLLFMAKDGQDALIILKSGPYWFFCIVFAFIFYLGYYILVPKLFFRHHYFYYTLSLLLLLNVVYFSRPFDRLIQNNRNHEQAAQPQSHNSNGEIKSAPPAHETRRHSGKKRFNRSHKEVRIDIVSIVLFILSAALAMAIRVTGKWRETERKALQADADKVKAELSFLKAQINPHFLFNTLNNIYTLSVMQHPNTSESIMKLSNIMRYVTDDVMQDTVLLQNEINCITDYIDLQKLRLGKTSPLDFEVKGDASIKRIAPLILLTFIENTFKYGISKKETSPINILIEIKDGICFECSNRIFEERFDDGTGIGLDNTRQRLRHAYGDNFKLNISSNDGYYKVHLYLPALA